MITSTFARKAIVIFAIVIALCVVGFTLSTCLHGVQSQKRDAVVAKTTGKALDRVAEQTPVIRQGQKEKENEVSAIEGSDARLPDGFARDLQRVRDRKHD